MFGSARTVEPTTGLRQLGMLLAAVILLIALAGAVALGQLFAAKPVAGPAHDIPAFVPDGRTYEAADEAGPATGGYGGWNGPRLGGEGSGSNGTRIAH